MQIPAIRYSRDTTDFTKTLRARVDAYFKENNLSRKGRLAVAPENGRGARHVFRAMGTDHLGLGRPRLDVLGG